VERAVLLLRLPRHRNTSGEEIHVFVAVGLACGFQVVRFAQDPAVRCRRRAAAPSRDDVVDLGPNLRAADSTRSERPLALAPVPDPHLPLHLGRHGSLSLLLLLDEQFQRRREHLLVGRSWLNV